MKLTTFILFLLSFSILANQDLACEEATSNYLEQLSLVEQTREELSEKEQITPSKIIELYNELQELETRISQDQLTKDYIERLIEYKHQEIELLDKNLKTTRFKLSLQELSLDLKAKIKETSCL